MGFLGVRTPPWLTVHEGLGELGCSVLSALLSSTGQYFACLSICVPITDSCQYVRGCLATGHLPPARVFLLLERHETGPFSLLPPLPPLGQEGLAGR